MRLSNTCTLCTETVDFTDMVKAFMYRETHPNVTVNEIKKDFQSKKEKIDAEYDKYLGDAIDLCNSNLGLVPRKIVDRTRTQLLCQNIKANMKKYRVATTGKQRYVPLVNALNAILSSNIEPPRVIFVVNDPMIVQSDHLPVKSKRKPDIIKVSLKTFKRWLRLPDNTDFDTCRNLVATGNLKIFGKLYWIDVEQFWELKSGDKLGSVTEEKVEFHSREACSTKESVPSAVEAESSAPKRRRADDEEDGQKPRKRLKAAGGRMKPLLSEVPAVEDDIQCASYAIERFRATWKITHVSGIFLEANFLNLLWYDPQGCIKSSRIDIIQQLPLLVLLVKLQQRTHFWSGLRDTRIPEKFHLEGRCASRFHLLGRMTACTDITQVTGNLDLEADSTTRVSGAREPNRYFKSSWPEDDRPKEAHIIQVAKERALQLLPTEFQPFVLNHLPDVDTQLLIPETCTAIIRLLLDLPIQGSRTQYLMISKRLSSVRTIVHDPSFKRVLFEIIRVHRLIWVLGIAHCDISFHNLMFDGTNGILNDFDLALIMEPGATSPPSHHRTETSTFMSIELLTEQQFYRHERGRVVPRLYRYELESFAWVLLYASICVVDGEEKLNILPFRDWVRLTPTELGSVKSTFVFQAVCQIYALVRSDSYQAELISIFRIWLKLSNDIEDAKYDRKAPSIPLDGFFITRVVSALGFSHDEWIDFEISSKDTFKDTPRNPMMPASTSAVIVEVEDPSSASDLPVVGATVNGGSDENQGRCP